VGAIFLEEWSGFLERIAKVTDLSTDSGNHLAIGLSLYWDEHPETFDPALKFISEAGSLAKKERSGAAERLANRELAFTLMMSAMTGRQKMLHQRAVRVYLR
jgi:hypothetical protein